MTKDEYFKLIILQKWIHVVIGASVGAMTNTDIRPWAIGVFVLTLIILRQTEKKTEEFEDLLKSQIIKKADQYDTEHR